MSADDYILVSISNSKDVDLVKILETMQTMLLDLYCVKCWDGTENEQDLEKLMDEFKEKYV